ncbi:MAG: hypothetical protein FH761_08465 [Firmicutes bacterium]|nr:hypothetical protein [Bacillota bacterium]
MNKVKGFSYDTKKHEKIIVYVESQQNQSKYIWSLVKRDMEKKSIEEIVKKEIQKALSNMKLDIKKEEPKIDPSEINSILAM